MDTVKTSDPADLADSPIRPAAAAPEADEMIVALALRWAMRCHAVTGGEFVMCIARTMGFVVVPYLRQIVRKLYPKNVWLF